MIQKLGLLDHPVQHGDLVTPVAHLFLEEAGAHVAHGYRPDGRQPHGVDLKRRYCH